MKSKLNQLERKINYHFKNSALLRRALTHRSVHSEHNERLEFLGDAILNFTIGEALFIKKPHAKEGELSRYRALLVCGESLAQVALELNVSDYLILGPGELRAGGFRRKSILADTLEAIIAAIYLDSDILTCQKLILEWFEARICAVSDIKAKKDPKSTLQEYVQAKKLALPKYKILKTTGADHDQTFHVECSVGDFDKITIGEGSTRRVAEQVAAAAFLKDVLHVDVG